MRTYRESEICLLLLYGMPGENTLKERLYQKMMQAFSALGPGAFEWDADLSEDVLLRLGCSTQEAGEILHRLTKKSDLLYYLRKLEAQGIFPVTRLSVGYPQRLRMTLGKRAPLVLWCSGNEALFSQRCISLVGSRQLQKAGRAFAAEAGKAIAAQGFCYCSGGAAGADTVGFEAACRASGTGIIFIADSLLECCKREIYRQGLGEGRLLLVSEGGVDEHFSAQRALSRNRLIHSMGEKTLVAQSAYGSGGTWSGTIENLKGGWSTVLVNNAQPDDPGTAGLIQRGGIPVSIEQLSRLEALGDTQLSLL